MLLAKRDCSGWSVADLAAMVAAFGQVLHAAGIPATPERRARFAQAIVDINPSALDQLYWAGRVTLLSNREQFEIYDRVFDQVFKGADFRGDSNTPAPQHAKPSGDRQLANPGTPTQDSETEPQGTVATPGEHIDSEDRDEEPAILAAASEIERLRDTDFAKCTREELDLIASLVSRLSFIHPRRPSRRSARHTHGHEIDLRATIHKAHSTAGDTVYLQYRKRKDRPSRVVFIADVSGSMEPYARVYLHLMRSAVRALHAEAFVFATSLTRLTRFLAQGKPDLAYRKVAQNTRDWSGGTRIGKALMTFIKDHGQRGIARGAVIVIVSDGWEIDDPALIAQAMQRLSRMAHQIIWVNPRKAARGYEPLVGGMVAAMPFVDTFISGHSVRALEEVLDAIKNATATTRSHERVG